MTRATLGNESVSIGGGQGGGQGGVAIPAEMLIDADDANPTSLAGSAERVGRSAAKNRAYDIFEPAQPTALWPAPRPDPRGRSPSWS